MKGSVKILNFWQLDGMTKTLNRKQDEDKDQFVCCTG